MPNASGPGKAIITIGSTNKPIPPTENFEKPVIKPATNNTTNDKSTESSLLIDNGNWITNLSVYACNNTANNEQ
jgi:hypothetical protein